MLHFFHLDDDKASARVRFLVPILDAYLSDYRYAVHRVEPSEDNSYHYAQCTVDNCKYCEAGLSRKLIRVFIPLYNYETQRVEIWDRSQFVIGLTLDPLYKRYSSIPSKMFKITRHGKKFDKLTSYEVTFVKDVEITDEITEDIRNYIENDVIAEQEVN